METLPPQAENTHEPLLNVPPLTLSLCLALVAVFAVLQNPSWAEIWTARLAFVPADFSQMPLAKFWTVLSYALLHFGWPHILVNVTGLLAFGSGVERLLGRKYFAAIFIGGAIIGALGHWALFPHSAIALGGASAGISALFGAALPLLMQRRDLFIASIVFIITNIVLGQIGMPDEPGLAIAWQAHLFGFFFGLGFALLSVKMRRLQNKL